MPAAALGALGAPSGCRPRRTARRASRLCRSPGARLARPNGAKRVRAKSLVKVEAPGGTVAPERGVGEGPVADTGTVVAGSELERAPVLGLQGDLVQGGLAVQVVVGHDLVVDDQVTRVAG